MTGCVVIRLFFFQWRDDLSADRLGLPTARMEIAATWRVHRAGHIPFENDAFALGLDVWIGHRNSRKECLGVWMQRHLVQIFTLRQFRHASKVHHCYSIT